MEGNLQYVREPTTAHNVCRKNLDCEKHCTTLLCRKLPVTLDYEVVELRKAIEVI